MFETFLKQIDSNMAYVISPDHPFLMTPPDCLIAQNGKINAYYVIHSNEKKRLKNLLSRLALSRLALHVHTKHILVIDSQNYDQKQSSLSDYFDVTISNLELRSSLLLLNNHNEDSIEKAMLGRDEHYVKYNTLYNQSLQQYKADIEAERPFAINPDNFDDVFYSDWLSLNNMYRNYPQFKSEYFHRKGKLIISVPEFKGSSRKLELLKNICLSAIQVDSRYSNGTLDVDYHSGKLIITDDFPIYQNDEYKSLRSAAFSGLSMTRAKSESSLENYFTFLDHKIEENIYEHNKKKNRYHQRNHKR